eukprot:937385-Pelagomonas_calceolata.AAC.2
MDTLPKKWVLNVQGCQYPCNKGQGLLGFWDCCSLLHSRTMPAPLCPPPGHREDYSVICLVYTMEEKGRGCKTVPAYKGSLAKAKKMPATKPNLEQIC